LTPNQIINKVIAHELRNDIKPKAPSSPTHNALACKQVKKLKKMTIKCSSVMRKKMMQEDPQMKKKSQCTTISTSK